MKALLLKTFCTLFILIVGFSINTNAQIIYTDVIPDSTFFAGYNLDLNNDGSVDFKFVGTAFAGCTSCIPNIGEIQKHISPFNTNVLDSNRILDTGTRPKALLMNDTISDSQLSWNSGQNQILYIRTAACSVGGCNISSYGFWNDTTENYLGLQLVVNGQIYFGWARLNGSASIIKDYAYNSMAGQYILAGDTGAAITGINKQTLPSTISISPNPFTNEISIKNKVSGTKIGEVVLYNVMGKEILRSKTIGTETKLNTEGIAAGFYFLRVLEENFKVIREN